MIALSFCKVIVVYDELTWDEDDGEACITNNCHCVYIVTTGDTV